MMVGEGKFQLLGNMDQEKQKLAKLFPKEN